MERHRRIVRRFREHLPVRLRSPDAHRLSGSPTPDPEQDDQQSCSLNGLADRSYAAAHSPSPSAAALLPADNGRSNADVTAVAA